MNKELDNFINDLIELDQYIIEALKDRSESEIDNTKELFSEFIEHYNNQYKYVPNFKTRYQLYIIVKVLNDEELNRYYYNEYKKSPFIYESKENYISLRSEFSLERQKDFYEILYTPKRAVHCFKRVMRRLNEIFRDEEENLKQSNNLRFIKILKQIGWI